VQGQWRAYKANPEVKQNLGRTRVDSYLGRRKKRLRWKVTSFQSLSSKSTPGAVLDRVSCKTRQHQQDFAATLGYNRVTIVSVLPKNLGIHADVKLQDISTSAEHWQPSS
jgi:hypothetical protein